MSAPNRPPSQGSVAPARIGTVVLVALLSTGVLWLLLDTVADRGYTAPPLPWTAVLGTAVLAFAVIVAGLPVRRWVRGDRDRVLDPISAARTFVLAKAAAYGGAALVGWYAAQAVVLLPDLVGDRRARFVIAVLAALAALAIAVAGLVVQRWCRVPPSDDDLEEDDPRRDPL